MLENRLKWLAEPHHDGLWTVLILMFAFISGTHFHLLQNLHMYIDYNQSPNMDFEQWMNFCYKF